MMRRLLASLMCASLLAATASARAADDDKGKGDDEGEYQGEDVSFDAKPSPEEIKKQVEAGPLPERRLSLSLSAFHLFLPVLHIVAELKVKPKLGVGAVVGAGRATANMGRDHYPAYEIGVQGNYYVKGSFDRGWQAGAELVYTIVNADAGRPTGIGRGLGGGLYAGWKWTWRRGLMVDIQAGVLYFITDNDDSGLEPLLNLDIGWSF